MYVYMYTQMYVYQMYICICMCLCVGVCIYRLDLWKYFSKASCRVFLVCLARGITYSFQRILQRQFGLSKELPLGPWYARLPLNAPPV